MNTMGETLRLTSFGESHGPAMGGVIDGFPPGFLPDMEALRAFLRRRRPGNGVGVSPRKEEDEVEFLSGFHPDGRSLGTPIAFIVRNTDARPQDYTAGDHSQRGLYRPNHADFTYLARYGLHDRRGGGRSSARDTVSRVVAGALASQWLSAHGIEVKAWLEDEQNVKIMAAEARIQKDSVGGVVACSITGMPPGAGNPVFHKLSALLAGAMLSVNAAMGFEYGEGFNAARMKGSEMADELAPGASRTPEGHIIPTYLSNHCGGLNGGITNGMPVTFRVAFKPTPSIGRPLRNINETNQSVEWATPGRHDACVAIRAVPVVEAVAALVCADILLSPGSPLLSFNPDFSPAADV
ncbi:MAG: chorismate synthase [Muribaculum sp.]|nr:chorismate synthase [Muribaculum sp.]